MLYLDWDLRTLWAIPMVIALAVVARLAVRICLKRVRSISLGHTFSGLFIDGLYVGVLGLAVYCAVADLYVTTPSGVLTCYAIWGGPMQHSFEADGDLFLGVASGTLKYGLRLGCWKSWPGKKHKSCSSGPETFSLE